MAALCFLTTTTARVRLKEFTNPEFSTIRHDGQFGAVSVSIGAFEQRFLLTLQPDDEFLAPGYSESRLGVPPDLRGYGLEPLRTCLYSGSVDGDRESTAALSICGGLMGSFWVHGQEYFISPRVQPKVKIPVVHDPRWVSEGRVVLEQHLLETRERRDSGIDPQPIEASRCGVNTSMDENIHRWTRPLRRVKRFASKARFVEILVVADESMVRHHGNDLEHYLLTLMGIAARLYRHPSLQNAVRLVVVRLLILGVKDKGPKVSSNAALTLRTFCSWQKRLNRAADKHVEHFDTAVLFTKKVGSRFAESFHSVSRCPLLPSSCALFPLSPTRARISKEEWRAELKFYSHY